MEARREKIVLCDVDDTLVRTDLKTGINHINDELINALILEGTTDIYLFSDMGLSDIIDSSIDPNYISRPQLVNYLKSKGLNVLGVITPADAGYDMGLGKPYADIYMPQYKRLMKGDLPPPERIKTDEIFNTALESFSGFKDKAEAGKLEGRKATMYRYVRKQLPDVKSIRYFDDSDKHIEDVKKANEDTGIELETVEVNFNKKKSPNTNFENRPKLDANLLFQLHVDQLLAASSGLDNPSKDIINQLIETLKETDTGSEGEILKKIEFLSKARMAVTAVPPKLEELNHLKKGALLNQKISEMTVEMNKNNKFTKEEMGFLTNVFQEMLHTISEPKDLDESTKNILSKAEKVAVTSGFRGAFNWICKFFKYEPKFTIAKNSEISNTFKAFKANYVAITTTPEQQLQQEKEALLKELEVHYNHLLGQDPGEAPFAEEISRHKKNALNFAMNMVQEPTKENKDELKAHIKANPSYENGVFGSKTKDLIDRSLKLFERLPQEEEAKNLTVDSNFSH